MEWTKIEIRLLEKYYRNYSTYWLAYFFNRTNEAVRKKANRRGLRKSKYLGYCPSIICWGKFMYGRNIRDKYRKNR